MEHFQRVLGVLETRGLSLGTPPVDDYAASLRRAAQVDTRGPKLGAARRSARWWARSSRRARASDSSCSRGTLEKAGEREVSAFYTELLAAEARHYRSFLDLAASATAASREEVLARLDILAEHEAEIVRGLARGCRNRVRPSTR